MKRFGLCLILACLLATTDARAGIGQHTGINSQSVINASDAIFSVPQTICSAVNATGTCPIFANKYGYASHTLQISTTSAPTYVVQLLGCYDLLCASQPVTLLTTGSVTTTPLTIGTGGFFPYLQVNVSTLSGGTITVKYIGVGDPDVGDANSRTILGNSNRPSFTTTLAVTVPTAAASLAAIEGDAINRVRLRYLKVCLSPTALQTTAGVRTLVLFRTTAASTGGSTATPILFDTTDPAFSGILRSGGITTTPAGGAVTVANSIWSATIALGSAVATSIVCTEAKAFDQGQLKAPASTASVASGLALADLTGGAGGTGNYIIDAEWTAEPN